MDNVANMLTTIVNAQRVGKERAVVSSTVFKERLARFLQEKGAIAKVRIQETDKGKLIMSLSYDKGRPKIVEAKRISRPGGRSYVGYANLPYRGKRPGFYVVSTSEGLMDEQEARKKKLGGELICAVWEA